LLEFLELPDLKGKSFLDIGCGSGLHATAAFRAGASKITCFDLDPISVEATTYSKEYAGNPPNWEIHHGSVLDKQFISRFEPADIVYSWGVLHHTGKMWEAIENAASLLKPEGLFFIALYTTDSKSGYWTRKKQEYNRGGNLKKRWMESLYVGKSMLIELLRFRNPLADIMKKRDRGMSFMTDVRDWLGGYPYEHARVEEVLRFGRQKLGMELVNLKTGEACTEYLFVKRRA
jgi:2-polyprenyl-6-hydroxyphenyl methylase/3-demethylubiquinone-9 3-methyltransferase